MTGLWIPTKDLRPEECRCIWINYGDITGGWWRQYTRDSCPLHGSNQDEINQPTNEKEDTE